MTNISRIALIAAVAAVGIASPAFAQAFDPEWGTGNVQAFSFTPDSGMTQLERVAVHHARRRAVAAGQTGANAFALVPGYQGGSALDPASTGGGSIGYNENLIKDQ